jgi:FkbM family methyltransferase
MNRAFFRFAREFLERYPALQKPAHFVFAGGLRIKNFLLFSAIKKLGYRPKSISIGDQDRWVIETLRGKRGGYFLDLGAGDGFSDNNTYVLEKYYGWNGLCIEPNPFLSNEIITKYGRTSTCVSDVVDSENRDVEYVLKGQESGIIDTETDNNPEVRGNQLFISKSRGFVKRLRTKTLADILEEHSAPRVIDYFSFDVEGAETRILRNFPFDRYTFLTLTIERPTPELNSILFRNGYVFVRNFLFDSFYVHGSIPCFGEIERMPFEQIPTKAF